MKRIVLLALLASACHINDISFTPLGGGDDGPDDANGDSPIKLIDAPPGLPPQTRGFVAMQGAGYYVLHKAPNGDLTPAGPALQTGSAMAMAIATNRAGTHVYVGTESATSGNQLLDIPFNDVVPAGNARPMSLPCAPRRIVVHPSESNLVVTCAAPQSFTYALDSNGGLLGPAVQLPGGGNSPKVPAFSPDGSCLYLADPNSGGMRIVGLTYSSGTYASATQTTGPTGAADLVMHPNGNVLYLITDTVVQPYAVGAGCGMIAIGGGVPNGVQNPLAGAIDSQGGRLFVLGDRSASFSIATDGRLTAITGVPQLTGTLTGGTFDPALPNTMYVTSPSFNGVFQAAIDTGGGLTMGQGFSQASQVPSDFALAQ